MAPAGAAERGVSMIEVLIATVVLTVVMGALFGLLQSALHAWSVQPHASDQVQRLRVAASSLQEHLAGAASGISPGGDAAAALHDYLAPVLPYRFGDTAPDPPGTFRADAISVMSVPHRAAFTRVLAIQSDVGNQAVLETALDCGTAARPRCGFDAGQQVVLLDRYGRWDLGVVVQAGDGTLVVLHPSALRVRADADPVVTALAMHTYYLDVERGTGTPQLVHYDGDRTSMPAVDHVVGLAFEYWGEPLPPVVARSAPRPRATYGPPPPPVGMAGGSAWPDGESCTFAVVDGAHVPRLAVLGGAETQVPLSGALFTDGPWCPDDTDPERYDADLLRIRRVRVRLRLQPAVSWLRRRGGSLSLADYGVEFDVTPRTLALSRSWQ